jgi:hypothetical protein
MPAVLISILKGIGATLLKMAAPLISEVVIKHMVLSSIDYYITKYEKRAAKTEDQLDDVKARKLRQLFATVSKQWQ